MKISCNIIRDLLPLYVEDLASEDTRCLVDEHICNCEDCANALESMKTEPPAVTETAAESLNKVKKRIRRRRIVSVLAAVLTVITVASAVFTYLFTPFQLTREQALDDFYVREDGAIVIDYSDAVIGRSRFGTEDNRIFLEYSTRYDMWRGAHRDPIEKVFGTDGTITEEERMRYEDIEIIYGRFESVDGKITADGPIPGEENGGIIVEWESEKNWWYADPRGLGNDILLHDAGKSHPEYHEIFSPIYPVLFFGGIACCLILLLLQKKFHRLMLKEMSVRLAVLSGSSAASTLLVSSGCVFTSTVGIIDQYWGWMIPMNTVCLMLTVLFWRQLYLLDKQDKTI